MQTFKKMTLAAALLVAMMGMQMPARADNPPPTKIATINIVKAFGLLDAKRNGDAEIEVLGKRLEDEKRTKENELTQLRDEMKAYTRGTDIYRDTEDKMIKKAMEIKTFNDYMDQKLLMETRLRTAAIYKLMNKAVEDYSRAQGIALVLVTDDADLEGARTPQDLLSKITVRKVIYAHESLDITTPIVDQMNSQTKVGSK